MSLTLRQICLVANRLQPVLDDLIAVFGLEVCFVDEAVGIFGLENSFLPIDTNFIEVVSPVKENTADQRNLKISESQVMIRGVRFNLINRAAESLVLKYNFIQNIGYEYD